MTATVAGIHLGLDTHANRPAANTVPDGSQYSCSTHSLIYKSNLAGNSWATWATLTGTTASGVVVRSDQVTFTSPVSVTATAAASATTIVTANAVAFDGSTPAYIEFFAPDCNWSGGNAGDLGIFYLYDGSSEVGFGGLLANQVAATAARQPMFIRIPLTPTNASHTYSIRGTSTSAARPLSVGGGAGGSGNRTAGYIAIFKVTP